MTPTLRPGAAYELPSFYNNLPAPRVVTLNAGTPACVELIAAFVGYSLIDGLDVAVFRSPNGDRYAQPL